MILSLEQLKHRLNTGGPDERIAALDELRAAVRNKQDLPFDDILLLLRERGGLGPSRETSRDVREAIYDAKRAVAVARGRQQGLRGSMPDPAELVEIADDALVWGAIEYVWDAVSIYDGIEILEAGLALATEKQGHFYAIWWTISEVRNGGFHQYFANPTGIVAPVALQGLRLLGESRTTAALAEASRLFEGGPIANQSHRLKVLRSLPKHAFEEQDNAFWDAYPHAFRLAGAYIREHPNEFFG